MSDQARRRDDLPQSVGSSSDSGPRGQKVTACHFRTQIAYLSGRNQNWERYKMSGIAHFPTPSGPDNDDRFTPKPDIIG